MSTTISATTEPAPPPTPTRRTGRRGWGRLHRLIPAALLGPAAIVVALGALAPLVILVLYSVGVLGDNEPAGFAMYADVLGDRYFIDIFLRTLRMSVVVTAIALVVAVPLAMVISRSRGWARTLLTCLVLLPLLVNIVVRNLGWVLLMSDNGIINSLLSPLGLSQSWTGTVTGVAIVLVHVSIPLIVLPSLAAIDQLQPAQREAAESLGAHPAVAFVRTTLPTLAPGLVAGAVLSFVVCIGSIVTPMLLGRGRLMMVPTLIVQQIESYRWERAAALSLLLFVLVLAAVVAMQYVSRRISSGKSERSRHRGSLLTHRPLTQLMTWVNRLPSFSGTWRWARGAYIAVMAIFLLMPMLVTLKNAADPSTIPQAGFTGLTGQWISEALSADGYLPELLFSLRLAVIAMLCGLVVSAAASWAIVRFRFPGRDAVLAFLMSPLLIPQAALAVGFVLFFLLIGSNPSFERLLFAHIVVTIPYMTRVLVSTFSSVDVQMEEAASALGARPLTVFRRITVPTVRSGVFTACLFGFLQSFDEAAISVLIASGDTTTMPVRLLSEMSFRPTPVGAAIAAVLITVTVAIVVPLERRFGLATSAVAPR